MYGEYKIRDKNNDKVLRKCNEKGVKFLNKIRRFSPMEMVESNYQYESGKA